MTKLAKMRLVFGGLTFLLALAGGYWGQPLIHGNEQAINLIVTVFSILAGFLVAIMTILTDPSIFMPGTWRIAELQRDTIQRRLIRKKWLFTLYLLTLGTIFATLLIKDQSACLTLWLERVYLTLAVWAFLLSLGLPTALLAIQQERVDSVIEERRRRAGLTRGNRRQEQGDREGE